MFVKNVVMGAKAAHPYPPDNSVAATWAEVEFVDFTAGNYRLAQRSRYKTAGTDGRDVGADIDAIDAAMDGQAIPSPARRRPAVRAPSAPTSPKRR